MDQPSYYLRRLAKAAALPAAQQGADVAAFLHHQALLDHAWRFFTEEFAIDFDPVTGPVLGMGPAVDAQQAPALARIIAAQVALPLDSYSLIKKQTLLAPTLCVSLCPFVMLNDVEGGGMSAYVLEGGADPKPELHSVLKATAACILLCSAAMKEQRQMIAMLPHVHRLSGRLIQMLERRQLAEQLRAELARFNDNVASSSSSSGDCNEGSSGSSGRGGGTVGNGNGSSGGGGGGGGGGSGRRPLLSFRDLLFCCYLLRWGTANALLFTPVPGLSPFRSPEEAFRLNLQAGQRMSALRPASPMGPFVSSSAHFALAQPREAWAELQRMKELAVASNDMLMLGIAWAKHWPAIEQGGCGSTFTLQQIKDVQREAKACERRFRDWCPSSMCVMYHASANQIQQVLDQASERGLPFDVPIPTETKGLLNRSRADLSHSYSQLAEDAKCHGCDMVRMGLKRCSQCMRVSYCSARRRIGSITRRNARPPAAVAAPAVARPGPAVAGPAAAAECANAGNAFRTLNARMHWQGVRHFICRMRGRQWPGLTAYITPDYVHVSFGACRLCQPPPAVLSTVSLSNSAYIS